MSKNSTVYDCTIIELDKHHRDEGNITVVENVKTVPFQVKRFRHGARHLCTRARL
mgnify:CR=1 FL=1